MLNALIGAVLLGVWLASLDINELHTLKNEGIVRVGEIDAKTERHGKHTTYKLHYHYETNTGSVADDFDVERDRYDSTNIGDSLTVTYLRTNPHHHRIGRVDDITIEDQQHNWLVGILLTALGLGGVFALIESDFRKQLSLARDGVPVIATITKKRTAQGKTTSYYLHYRFSLAQAPNMESQVSASAALYNRFDEGDALTVLCDRQNPHRNLPYVVITAAEIT